MIKLVWAALVAALPSLPSTYVGRHRVGTAEMWDEVHRQLPWQRARRRVRAYMRMLRRPSRHAGAVRVTARVVAVDVASWDWWQERRKAYEPALRAAGAW